MRFIKHSGDHPNEVPRGSVSIGWDGPSEGSGKVYSGTATFTGDWTDGCDLHAVDMWTFQTRQGEYCCWCWWFLFLLKSCVVIVIVIVIVVRRIIVVVTECRTIHNILPVNQQTIFH